MPESIVVPPPTPSLPAARLLRPRHWAWLWVVWFAILFYLSSLPGDAFDFDPPFDWFDKVEHATYFLLGGLLLGGWLVSNRSWPHRWWLIPVAALTVGAFDEWHQQFAPGRSALDPLDWLADLVGGSIALPLTRWWTIRFPLTNPPKEKERLIIRKCERIDCPPETLS